MTVMDLNLMQSVESVSRLVANSFVSGLWQGMVLAAGVALCLRLVPRATAAIRFAIWTAVFAVLAVMPMVHAYTLRPGGGTTGGAAVVQLDVRWSFAIAAVVADRFFGARGPTRDECGAAAWNLEESGAG